MRIGGCGLGCPASFHYCKMMEDLRQLVALKEKQNERLGNWVRFVMTIAAGGLALLLGTLQLPPDDIVARMLLASGLVFLGLGIVFGAAASHLEIVIERKILEQYSDEIQQAAREQRSLLRSPVIAAKPNWWQQKYKPGMMLSLLLAVVCFVAYGVRVLLWS